MMFNVDTSSKLLPKIPDVLTPSECVALIERINSLDPVIAPINASAGTRIRTDVRNNERVMFDDQDLANSLFEKARQHVPERMLNCRLVGANERFRCYRYKPGMRFAVHSDASFERNESERSFYTYLIYLNGDFEGGETNFATVPELSIKPVTGLGLVFQHPIIHEGAEVLSGVKYVARTDLMYRDIDK